MDDNVVRLCRKLQHALADIPSVDLGIYPTPVRKMTRYGRMLEHGSMYVKRDDLTGLGIGGNKTRSLEFLLGEAQANGATTIIAGGATQSNLCALTAAACARLDLECILVHNNDPPTEVRGNALLNALCGAQSTFIGDTDETQRAKHMQKVARQVQKTGKTPYVIENSSATARGALGYVAGALELVRQCFREDLQLDHVAIPGAMAGTSSGLVAGAALLGHPFHVHVINVEYRGDTLRVLIDEYTQGVFELLDLRPAVPIEEVMEIHHCFLGDGYAQPTAESIQALFDLAQKEGIYSEIIYTSKTLAGLTSLIRSGRISAAESACFWHTGGIGALFSQGEVIWADNHEN